MTAMTTATLAPEFLTAREAEQFTRLSFSTLKRRAKEGHPVGLVRRGLRVLFDVNVLRKYLSAPETAPATPR